MKLGASVGAWDTERSGMPSVAVSPNVDGMGLVYRLPYWPSTDFVLCKMNHSPFPMVLQYVKGPKPQFWLLESCSSNSISFMYSIVLPVTGNSPTSPAFPCPCLIVQAYRFKPHYSPPGAESLKVILNGRRTLCGCVKLCG